MPDTHTLALRQVDQACAVNPRIKQGTWQKLWPTLKLMALLLLGAAFGLTLVILVLLMGGGEAMVQETIQTLFTGTNHD
jgi:hypothetical protein